MKLELNNVLLLCTFDDQCSEDDSIVNKLWSGQWAIEDIKLCQELLLTELETEPLLNIINRCKEQGLQARQFLHLATNCFLTFCEQNWNLHPDKLNLEEFLGTKWPKNVDARLKLECDSEPVFANILYPELLYFALQVFDALVTIEGDLLHLWWSFRAKVVHQRALENASATIYSEIEVLMGKLSSQIQVLNDKRTLQTLLNLEITQAFLIYKKTHKAEEFFRKASDFSGSQLKLTGIWDKRTKSSTLPPQIEMDDDELYEIGYREQISQADLSNVERMLCLLIVQLIQNSQPSDEEVDDAQLYIKAILSQGKGPWAARVAAQLSMSLLEANHQGDTERAVLDCETVINDKAALTSTSRLSYLWASGLQPAWSWRRQLADLHVSAGLVKGALQEYQELQLWEDLVSCYSTLELRHEAAQVIQKQIEIKPTVKLYCLLGDVTDDVSWYEKAWEFSGHQSSRAQRHWADHLLDHHRYDECIPHYEKSLEINSLQASAWLKLGNAARALEHWETAVEAYTRCTSLQPDTLEAWSTLVEMYTSRSDKQSTYKMLLGALTYHYDNLKLWEDMITVSLDTCNFKDVMQGIHRVLNIQGRYEDLEVISTLVRAVLQDQKDADGNKASRLQRRMLQLFARLTATHEDVPEMWELYSHLCPTALMKARKLLQACRAFTQSGSWANDPESCKKGIDLAQALLECSMKARKDAQGREIVQCDQQLSFARTAALGVISVVEKENWPHTKMDLQKLKDLSESS